VFYKDKLIGIILLAPIQTQMMDYGVVKTLLELVDTKKMENDEEDSIVVLCVRI
jgi:hypothetical protein